MLTEVFGSRIKEKNTDEDSAATELTHEESMTLHEKQHEMGQIANLVLKLIIQINKKLGYR